MKKTVTTAIAIAISAIPVLSVSPPVRTVPLQWQQPLFYVDGLEMPESSIANFTFHYGLSSGNYMYQYTVAPNLREESIPVPYGGKWYFVATVTDIHNLTSEYSNEVIRTVDYGKRRPKPPNFVRAVKS